VINLKQEVYHNKLNSSLHTAEKKYRAGLNQQQKALNYMNDATGKRITDIAKAREMALLEDKRRNAKALRQEAMFNNQRAKAIQNGYDRIASIRKSIKDKGIQSGTQIFDDKAVKQNLAQLNRMMSSFGKVGGSSLRQINSQYAKLDSNIKRVTKATRNQAHSFGAMMREGMKSMLVWTVVATALYAPIRALRNGLQTLKEIDTQLVNIAKVTGRTADEMKELAKQASAVGVAFGRTAQEYLEAMTEFSRAGYGDNAEQLSELSLLLQNVGDIQGETANQMLIAIDAAYGLGGSMEELSKVIDSLNTVNLLPSNTVMY
jgi:hypothetical protein